MPGLPECLPLMDDPGSQNLRGWAVAARRVELETVLALIRYIEGFEDSYRWRTGELVPGPKTSPRYRGVKAEPLEAAITYAAQALGWSEYRAEKTYQDTVLARKALPRVWEWFTHLRITTFAVSKIARAARKLSSNPERLARLDRNVPAAAAKLRPAELDDWLRRFTAVEDPREHAEQCARDAEGRYVYIRPTEDREGMSLLIAELPTLVAEAMGRRLSAVARSQTQKIPHNPVTAGLAQQTGLTSSRLAGVRPTAPDPVQGRWRQASTAGPSEVILPESYDQGDTRTLAQREADLLCAWVFNGTVPDADAQIEAQISLLVPIETLAEEADYPGFTSSRSDVIPAGVVRHLARSPGIRRRWHTMYVTDDPLPPSEAPGEYFYGPTGVEFNIAAHSYQGYKVPKLLREHIYLRDGTCTVPGCNRVAERGDIDHRTPWPTGQTAAVNLRALCRTHHRLKTAGFRLTTTENPQRSLPEAALWPLSDTSCTEFIQAA